jgi:ATP-dependent protease ClpP protease subunit
MRDHAKFQPPFWLAEGAAEESSNDDSSNENNIVQSSSNKIYFYSEVTRPKILALNKKIAALNVTLLNQANTLVLDKVQAKIRLHINSYGGSVFAGFSAVDYIKTTDVPVVSIIDGCAASAATLMSVVADERYMHEHAFMLIHQLSSTTWGKYEELKDDMKNNDLLMATIKKIYSKHAKIPKKKLNEILKHDLWFDAKMCLQYGLIDDII